MTSNTVPMRLVDAWLNPVSCLVIPGISGQVMKNSETMSTVGEVDGGKIDRISLFQQAADKGLHGVDCALLPDQAARVLDAHPFELRKGEYVLDGARQCCMRTDFDYYVNSSFGGVVEAHIPESVDKLDSAGETANPVSWVSDLVNAVDSRSRRR